LRGSPKALPLTGVHLRGRTSACGFREDAVPFLVMGPGGTAARPCGGQCGRCGHALQPAAAWAVASTLDPVTPTWGTGLQRQEPRRKPPYLPLKPMALSGRHRLIRGCFSGSLAGRKFQLLQEASPTPCPSPTPVLLCRESWLGTSDRSPTSTLAWWCGQEQGRKLPASCWGIGEKRRHLSPLRVAASGLLGSREDWNLSQKDRKHRKVEARLYSQLERWWLIGDNSNLLKSHLRVWKPEFGEVCVCVHIRERCSDSQTLRL
ncbi:hypothetical protein H1C71_011976, partial [Ictidomys tridecemlineatus]